MQRSLALVVAGLAAFGGALAPARAADEKVLRHLTYSVRAGVVQTQQQPKTDQLGTSLGDSNSLKAAPDAKGSAIVVSGATSTASSSSSVRGTVTLDVVGVLTTEGALAIYISQSGDKNIPPVRIDLLGDGRVIAGPQDHGKLSPEELEIAGMCARDYLAGHPLTAGAVWNVDGDRGRTNYRVINATDDRAALVIESNSRPRTGSGDQRSTVQLTYDTKRSVPVAATISRRSHIGNMEDLRTIDESFEYHLTDDTYASNAPK